MLALGLVGSSPQLAGGSPATPTPAPRALPVYSYRKLSASHPHDPGRVHAGSNSSTASCTRDRDQRSIVRCARSRSRRGRPRSAAVWREHFGEGITIWKTDLVRAYLAVAGRARLRTGWACGRSGRSLYGGDGWGLVTHDATSPSRARAPARRRIPLDPVTFKRAPARQGDRRRCAGEVPERVGVFERRDPGERLDDRLHCPDRPCDRPVTGSSICAACWAPPIASRRRRPEWHRVRRRGRSPVRDRQTLAQALRDRTCPAAPNSNL